MNSKKEVFTELLTSIENNIQKYKENGNSTFLSSSFQTYSVPLIHIVSRIDPEIPIVFLNTGFHFAETISFKNTLKERFNLNIIEVESEIPKISQLDSSGLFHYVKDTPYCCHVNKILPMENMIKKYDVWINGIRRDQNANREGMPEKMKIRHSTERYHPMLDWTSKMIWEYMNAYDLPKHPLESKGYLSIGCEPCTSRFLETQSDEVRTGTRWEGMKKTECGLHTDLAK